MFYSDTLLSKTAPLAKVWLAANIERKLTKTQILHSSIGQDCGIIINPEQVGGAPIALRLSGQLLLGVVRIYSRKARYLLDDCNEALMKIKMAFRPGNVDLPAHQSHAADPKKLILEDVLTELDLLAPMPNAELLLSQAMDLDMPLDTTIPDWDNSQFLSGSIDQGRVETLDNAQLEEFEDLDLGLGLDAEMLDESIEIGRPASEELPDNSKVFEDIPLDLDVDETLDMPGAAPDLDIGDDMDIDMGITDIGAGPEDLPNGDAHPEGRARSGSPLSSIRSSAERELQQTLQENTTTFEPEEEEESVHHAQRAKRRRVLHADADTELHSTQIREQQNDRSKILKPASFLPRDPMLLALMNMQKSGGFVSSILGDGRSQGWAPELRGILSLEVITRGSQLKRKRDSGVADLDGESEASAGAEKTPLLEFAHDDLDFPVEGGEIGGDTMLNQDNEVVQLPSDAGIQFPEDEAPEDDAFSPVPDNFDDTTAPLLHPADSGPVSLGTKHAVHLLRERFPADCEHNESQRAKTSLVFQDMLPEATTSRKDATKMFFEVLVLATKDAIEVRQGEQLGGPINIRSKRGLWGSWAETQAGGELASQTQTQTQTQAPPPAPAQTGSMGPPPVPAAVSVEA